MPEWKTATVVECGSSDLGQIEPSHGVAVIQFRPHLDKKPDVLLLSGYFDSATNADSVLLVSLVEILKSPEHGNWSGFRVAYRVFGTPKGHAHVHWVAYQGT